MMNRFSQKILYQNFRKLSLAAKFKEFGDPFQVIRIENTEVSRKLHDTEVLLKFLAAPINPADINMAQGVYGIKPALPATGGNEGVAVIEEVGSSVKDLKIGDWVLPTTSGFGTWTQFAKADETNLIKIANDIPIPYAATLSINPCTAYRLLRDFVNLKPGDVIIQNGANSMVGYAVIQMAREMGVKTINIIRSDRPETNRVNKLLTNLGGTVNITDAALNTKEFKEIMNDLPPCSLALNCVGGEVATNMLRILAPNGTMVTYGGMSRSPTNVPIDLLTSKQLKLKGFWVSEWYKKNSKIARSEMLDEITKTIREKKLSFFFEMHDLDDFHYALKKSQEQFYFRKIVLNLNYPDRFKEHDSKKDEEYEMFDAPYTY